MLAIQKFKFSSSDSSSLIKDKCQLLRALFHSLKPNVTGWPVAVSDALSWCDVPWDVLGLNLEMHKQAEVVKKLKGICAQVPPAFPNSTSSRSSAPSICSLNG